MRIVRSLVPMSLVLAVALATLPVQSPLAPFMVAEALAAVPSLMSYQGQLTDSGGTPVPDGNYSLTFTLYKVPSGGFVVWTETQSPVAVSKGVFSVLLGSVTPLDVNFDQTLYLAVAVNGGTEMTPRTRLAAAPYAMALRLPYKATVTDTVNGLTIENTTGYPGATLRVKPDLEVRSGSGFPGIIFMKDDATPTWPGVQILNNPGGQSNILFTGASGVASIMGANLSLANTGFSSVIGTSGSRYITADGAGGTGQNPSLRIQGPASLSLFDTGASGDAAVQLPAGSIGPAELAMAPGIAHSQIISTQFITSATTMADVDTIAITIPGPGYIVVHGEAQTTLWGWAGTNYLYYQIDESQGGGVDVAKARVVGSDSWPNAGSYAFSLSAQRVYYKASAGTYRFRFEAMRYGTLGTAACYNPSITAMYIPSSYGPVTTLVTNGEELAGFGNVITADATPLPEEVAPGLAHAARGPAYKVDLRELELKVAREKAEAERAERELAEARAAAAIEKMRATLDLTQNARRQP